jgi:DDE superfamily endonuclease
MDNRDEYGYGWNEKGARFHALKSGGRGGRVNMIAAWCNGELFAPFTVEGACNRSVFETWLETCLIPSLKPGQLVIADNATFHCVDRIISYFKSGGFDINGDYLAIVACFNLRSNLGLINLIATSGKFFFAIAGLCRHTLILNFYTLLIVMCGILFWRSTLL